MQILLIIMKKPKGKLRICQRKTSKISVHRKKKFNLLHSWRFSIKSFFQAAQRRCLKSRPLSSFSRQKGYKIYHPWLQDVLVEAWKYPRELNHNTQPAANQQRVKISKKVLKTAKVALFFVAARPRQLFSGNVREMQPISTEIKKHFVNMNWWDVLLTK